MAAGCSLIGYDPALSTLPPDAGERGSEDADVVPSEDARVDQDAPRDAAEDAQREDAQLDDAQVDASAEDAAFEDARVEDAGDADASDAQVELDAGGLDAALDAAVDGGGDAGLDAALPPSTVVDAGSDNSEAGVPWDAGTATCAGTRALNLCWYLAPASTSCNSFCASHGGFDTRAFAAVGVRSQGGTLANCRVVLNALGLSGGVTAGTRSDGRGFGCHQWQQPRESWWLASPAASASVSSYQVRPACACAR